VQYATAPAGWGWLWARSYELLPTYLAYVLAGCYVAVHRERVDAYVRTHGRRLLEVAAVAAAVALGAYAWQLGSMAPRSADAVLQPAMTASCVAAALALYVMGLRWTDRRPPGGTDRASRVVATASTISFGVYLAHPLVLGVLLAHGLSNGHQVVPAPAATLLALAGALTGAAALSLVAVRTPLSLPLTGRRRQPRPVRRPSPPGLNVSMAGTR
jgi:peptidoglycan/LPS O-acetylase OafA/YrhL